MKNTLIITAEEIASMYSVAMLEHLSVGQGDVHPAEFALDVIEFGSTLKGICSKNNEVALGIIRQELRHGSTMMMLSDENFTQLEIWNDRKEDFQIAIFREDGSAVGIVKKDDVSW